MNEIIDHIERVYDRLSRAEAELGLPKGFLLVLRNEDDWSFVIKSHALIEAAVSRLLSISAGDPRMASVFQRLELSDVSRGKLAFVSELELLDKPVRRFIRSLSELRNRLVHDIRNVSFTFDAHYASLDTNQRKRFREFCGYFVEYSDPSRREQGMKNVVRNLKFSIWWGITLLLADIELQSKKTKIKELEAEVGTEARRVLDELLRSTPPDLEE